MKKKVSLLIPCYNEQQSLPLLYPQLLSLIDQQTAYDWELMFVDDGSRDNTLSVLRQLREQDQRVNYVSLSRNFGKENAMLAGFDHVTGDCVVVMDADGQHPPTVIPEMLRLWQEGHDDVYAKRTTRGHESWLRKHASLLFYKVLQSSSRFDMLQNVGDFRLLDRRCIDALRQLRESERYTKGMYCWIGFNKAAVAFEQGDRQAGTSSWSYRKLFAFAIDGITSFSTAPLRLATVLGLVVAVAAFVYMLFVLTKAIIWGDPVAGYPTLVVLVLFLGGVQLLSLGIIGEYVGRIYNESKHRPNYLVAHFND